MELQTIRQVSQDYGISRRMLCYYEEVGLLVSQRVADYAYRVYDDIAIKQLQQIIILRKLQIPVKQIKTILENQSAVEVIEIFKQNIDELDEKITAMATLKSILARFVFELQEIVDVQPKLDLLNDKIMITTINSLSFPKNKIEENAKMSKSNVNIAAEYNVQQTDVVYELEYLDKVLKKDEDHEFSVGLDIARNDDEILAAFDFYQRAFGATVVSKFVPHGMHIHLKFEIHGIGYFMNQNSEYDPHDPAQQFNGGLWGYSDENKLKKVIDVLSEDAINVKIITEWEHWPLAAFITDKYGVKWALHS